MSCTSDKYLEPIVLILLWLILLASKQSARVYHFLELTLSTWAETSLHAIRRGTSDMREWKQRRELVAKKEEIVERGNNVSATECLRDQWKASIEWDHGQKRPDPRNSAFYWTIRSFERFCQKNPHGLLSQDCKRFDAPAATFYHRYSSSSYWHLFKHLAGGVIANTWRHAVMSALWAGLLEWAYFHIKCRDAETSARIRNGLFGVISVHEALLPLVSFLLTVYVTGRMKKHTDIIYSAWAMRGKMNCLALFVGGIVSNNTHPNLQFKHKLFRWLSVLHFYVYQDICKHLSAYQEFHWHSKGLLTRAEAKELSRTTMKVELMFGWLMTHCHAGPENTSERQRVELLRLICHIRESYTDLRDICAWIPPISEAQLLAVIVEFFIAITPMALVMQNAGAGAPAYVWGMTGSAFLGLFFVGLLNMVRIVEDPFGEDLDDLNPDALLWSTETTLQAYLVCRESPEGLMRKTRAGYSFQDAMFHARRGKLTDSDLYVHGDGSEIVGRRVCDCTHAGPSFQVLVVQVYTGDIMFAGTDAAVWIQLYGSDDEPSHKFMLDESETNANPYENGTVDVFCVPYSGDDITKIDIGHEGGGQAAAWYLTRIVIQSSRGGKLWEFEANEWIDISKTDPGWRTYLPKRRWLPPTPWPAVKCSYQNELQPSPEIAPATKPSEQRTEPNEQGAKAGTASIYPTALQRADSMRSLDKFEKHSQSKKPEPKKSNIKKSRVLPEPEPGEDAALMSQQQRRSTDKSQLDTTRMLDVPNVTSDGSSPKTAGNNIAVHNTDAGNNSAVHNTENESKQSSGQLLHLRSRVDGLHSQLQSLAASKSQFDAKMLVLLQSIEENTRPQSNT